MACEKGSHVYKNYSSFPLMQLVSTFAVCSPFVFFVIADKVFFVIADKVCHNNQTAIIGNYQL